MRRKALWGSYVSDSVKSPDNRLDFITRALGSDLAVLRGVIWIATWRISRRIHEKQQSSQPLTDGAPFDRTPRIDSQTG